MAESYKILAQNAPSATSLTALYTVPASTSSVISSIAVCNQSSSATTFRLSLASGGAADAAKQYVYYDMPISGNDTFVATIGGTLATTDLIRCYAGASTLSFTVLGVEIS